jgi:hypothetical protein
MILLTRTVPLNLRSVNESGTAEVDYSAVLSEREKFFAIDIKKPFKLNAGTIGPCKVP